MTVAAMQRDVSGSCHLDLFRDRFRLCLRLSGTRLPAGITFTLGFLAFLSLVFPVTFSAFFPFSFAFRQPDKVILSEKVDPSLLLAFSLPF